MPNGDKKKKTAQQKKVYAEGKRATAAEGVKYAKNPHAKASAMKDLRKADDAQIKMRRAAKQDQAGNSTFKNNDYNKIKSKNSSRSN